MKRAIIVASLIAGSMSFSEAMEVTKVKKKYITIKDSQAIELETSDVISILDEEGEVTGEARILSVKGKRAKAYLMDGEVKKGYSVTLEGEEDEFERESGNSPYSRGKRVKRVSSGTSRSYGVMKNSMADKKARSFGIETGMLRNAAGITNVKAHMGLANGFALGAGLYSYDVTDEFSDLTITGETIALIGTKYFNNVAFSQGAYARLEVGTVSLSADSSNFTSFDVNGVEVSGDVSGLHVRSNLGYHWQWDNLYTDLYAGIQYISLEADATFSDGAFEDSGSASASATGFDLGFNFGIAF